MAVASRPDMHRSVSRLFQLLRALYFDGVTLSDSETVKQNFVASETWPGPGHASAGRGRAHCLETMTVGPRPPLITDHLPGLMICPASVD
jgi:hypothetical protein